MYQDVFDLEKIQVRDATVHVSSNSRFNTPCAPSPRPQIVRKIPSVRYYSTSIALYESCKYLRPGRSGVFRKPRWSFPSVSGLQTCISSSSETSIFATKFHQFLDIMEPVACAPITLSFRNAKRTYQDGTKPWHIGINQS